MKNRNTIILLLVVILLLGGLYYYFFSELKATGEEISALTNDTASKVNEESHLDSLQSIFSATTNERDELSSRFVGSDGAVDFITTVENLAAFAHLSHDTESVDTLPGTSSKYELLHIILRTTGTWQNTFYFTSLLETLPYNLNINQLNLHTTGDTTTASSTKSSVWEGSYDFTVVKLK